MYSDEYYTRTHEGYQKINKVIKHNTNKKLYKIRAKDSNGHIHQVIVTEGHSLILDNKKLVEPKNIKLGDMLYDYINN